MYYFQNDVLIKKVEKINLFEYAIVSESSIRKIDDSWSEVKNKKITSFMHKRISSF